jgi:arylsulfatase A-like enzyme
VVKAWCCLLAAALSPACARTATTRPRNVVIVTLDTTRADYLGPYASGHVATPSIDRIARDSLVFDEAITVAPLTLPAHCSLFTGLLPPRHGVRDNADGPLAPSHPLLAGVLRDRGFDTAAFVASTVLARDRGLARGFTTYRDGEPRDRHPTRRGRRADEVIDEALAWLRQRDDAPFFLWMHLYDAHSPYDAPEPFATRYAHDPYAGEIAFMDAQLGRLIDALDPDRTIVVLAGDHGESLGAHGETEHGQLLYQPVLHVPLITRVPGVAARRVPGVVRLVDVMPTVLALLGISGVTPTDGVSLLPLLRGDRMELETYSESLYPVRSGSPAVRSLRSGRYKLIASRRSELYDLHTDRYERVDLAGERRSLVAAMSRRLAEFDPAAQRELPNLANPSRDLCERLAALGYVSGAKN